MNIDIKNKKIRFIFFFILSFIVFLIVGLMFIGLPLITLKLKLLETIFKNNISSQLVFVAHCSGIVSLATYFSVVIGFLSIKIKTAFKKIVRNVIVLLTYNILRLIIIIYLAEKNIFFAEVAHTVSWFVVLGILLLIVLKDYNNCKM
jgi:exosortase/archaeosortase family protein